MTTATDKASSENKLDKKPACGANLPQKQIGKTEINTMQAMFAIISKTLSPVEKRELATLSASVEAPFFMDKVESLFLTSK